MQIRRLKRGLLFDRRLSSALLMRLCVCGAVFRAGRIVALGGLMFAPGGNLFGHAGRPLAARVRADGGSEHAAPAEAEQESPGQTKIYHLKRHSSHFARLITRGGASCPRASAPPPDTLKSISRAHIGCRRGARRRTAIYRPHLKALTSAVAMRICEAVPNCVQAK